MKLKLPQDITPYEPDPLARPAAAGLVDGLYVYVQDELGVVVVLEDGPHVHPKVLGRSRPAMYAGDMTVCAGQVVDLTNLSGTFQFDDPQGLVDVSEQLRRQGLEVVPGAIRFFTWDGSTPPRVLA